MKYYKSPWVPLMPNLKVFTYSKDGTIKLHANLLGAQSLNKSHNLQGVLKLEMKKAQKANQN